MEYAAVPEDEEWRISLIRELLDAKQEDAINVPLDIQEIEEILNHACTT